MLNLIHIHWLPMRKPLGPYEAAVVSIGGDYCSWEFTDYTMGIEPPRYPVPAPMIDVWFNVLPSHETIIVEWLNDHTARQVLP